jgi:hypothetical protein
MQAIKFSLGKNTYDNQPEQCTAVDFDDFVSQISNTGSTRKGQAFVTAPLKHGPHDNPVKNPGNAYWRIRNNVEGRRFIALDEDGVASPQTFEDFKQTISEFNSIVYTTASHTPAAPRSRALIELDRAVGYGEAILVGESIQRMIEAKLGVGQIKLDPSVYRGAQPVYTPLVDSEIFRFNGLPLNVDLILTGWPEPITTSAQAGGASKQQHISSLMASLISPPETPAEIAKVQAALAQVSADCPYPLWVRLLFSVHSTGWTCSKQLAQDWSMTAPLRYDQQEFNKVWSSAKIYGGIGIGTLFHHAKQAQLSRQAQTPVAQSNLPSTTDYSLGKLSIPTVAPPPRDYLFAEVVIPGTVNVIAGSGGSAKTTEVMDVCIHGALGLSQGPVQIAQFASLLFLAEETREERDRRFGALCVDLSHAERSRVEGLIYCEAAAGRDLRLTVLKDGNVYETSEVDRIIALAAHHRQQTEMRIGLIVIDHARLVMAGDPLSADHVTALLRALNRIAVKTEAAVLLIAHSPKSTYGKEGEPDPSEVFGSGAFVDHTRSAFVLHTMRKDEARYYGFTDDERKQHVSLSVVKANYGPSGRQWWFKKEIIAEWHVLRLLPVFLLPKGQAQIQSSLSRKICDLVKGRPAQLTIRVLRDRYSGVQGDLGASEREVRRAVERSLEQGNLILRAPTEDERKRYRISSNVREVLDLPSDGV